MGGLNGHEIRYSSISHESLKPIRTRVGSCNGIRPSIPEYRVLYFLIDKKIAKYCERVLVRREAKYLTASSKKRNHT